MQLVLLGVVARKIFELYNEIIAESELSDSGN